MRHGPTAAERILWFALRDRRLCGLKFRRQVPFGPHIADFYCAEARLVVECDGGGHDPARDAARDDAMRRAGLTVLRFPNPDILHNLTGVLTVIAERAKGPSQ
jgi:very-short-patch-repair endonuclease